jgi:hypothetical protein
MISSRSIAPLLLASALLGVGCATQTPERRAGPEPSVAVQRELGFQEIVRFGEDYAEQQGYQVAEVQEAIEVRPNYWRLRFDVMPKGKRLQLVLEFDESQRRVVKSTEVGGVAGQVVPGS